MGETIGKTKLVRNIVAKTNNVSIETCEQVVDACINEIVDLLVRGDKLVLKNFMSFETIERAEREGKDLKTGETVVYPPVKSVKCRVSKAVRDAVNAK